MADNHTQEQRSRNMARIRSTDTRPEVYLRKKLFAAGYRYRKNDRRLPGCPDIYLPKYRTAIFVHGCFWHRHKGCRYAYMPKSRVEYWESKFQRNEKRDSEVKELLADNGFRVIIVWECCVRRMMKDSREEAEILQRITAAISETGIKGTELYEFE